MCQKIFEQKTRARGQKAFEKKGLKNMVEETAKMASIVKRLKEEGKVVVTTNGSFDVLHIAHIKTLERAKALGDVLIVLLNSDVSVKANKGENRPIHNEEERAVLLEAMRCVDFVSVFDEKEVGNVLKKIKPDIHAKGGTYIKERIEKEEEIMKSVGGKFVLLPFEEGYSSTKIIEAGGHVK